nr:MAG TPA: hypothetical protein [Caudoviricetes sp.]
MSIDLLSFLSGGFGAAVGGALTMLATHMNNRSTAARESKRLNAEQTKYRADLIRSRGEELYEAFDRWASNIRNYYLVQSVWVDGGMATTEALSYMDGHAPDDQTVPRMTVCITAYFPLAERPYRELLSTRNQLAIHLANCRRSMEERGSPHSELVAVVEPIKAGVRELDRLANEVRSVTLASLRAL